MNLLYVGCLALAVGWAAAEVCVPLIECKTLVTSRPKVQPFAVRRRCSLRDCSGGVLCDSDAVCDKFEGPGYNAAYSKTSNKQPFDAYRKVLLVHPLKNRLKAQQEFVISSEMKPATVLQAVVEKLKAVADKVRRLAERGMNKVLAGSPEAMQSRFSTSQSSEPPLSGQASLQSVQVMTELNKMNAIGSMPLSTEARLFGDGMQHHAGFAQVTAPGSVTIPGCKIIEQAKTCQYVPFYRSLSGECNNLKHPQLGRARSAYSRLFPAQYEDGIFQPTETGPGGKLPSPRLVSQRVVSTSPRPDNLHTISVMLLGQFMNHDFISTPVFTLEGGGGLSCCGSDGSYPSESLHPVGCNPIRIPDYDPFYSTFGRKCMNHVRSLPAPYENCVAGPVNQLNQVSHFLDASNIYGSSIQQSNQLRAFTGGRFNTSLGDLLPQVNGRFVSGEGRLAENPGLTFLHTVWTREHNRVAMALARRHYDWDDERLFQEARRLVIGEYQHIIYNEYLPIVLGTQYTCEHGLEPVHGRSFQYSDQVDPTIKTEFFTAAFRFGHSQVHDAFVLRNEAGKIMDTLAMENTFFRSDLIAVPGAVAQFARALTRQKPRSVDSTFASAVHEKLFARNAPFGLDLIALNINRGRDHGLPSYATVLENCLQQSMSNSWSSLEPFFEPEVLQRLQSIYYSIYDIDLFIGGVAEKRKPGALVGEVFQCIIGEQFFNTRYGDRFFYDNGGQSHSFSHEQVREIQKASWARILCDNVKELDKMQPMALWQPCVSYNRPQHCSSHAISRVNLNMF